MQIPINDAPIIPDEGLGGLRLRDPIANIQESLVGLGVSKPGKLYLASAFEAVYEIGNGAVRIAVDVRNGKIFSLTACLGYSGSLFEKIRIGMITSEVQLVEPSFRYNEAEGMIESDKYPGVSLEFALADPLMDQVESLSIAFITVYASETRTLDGQVGLW